MGGQTKGLTLTRGDLTCVGPLFGGSTAGRSHKSEVRLKRRLKRTDASGLLLLLLPPTRHEPEAAALMESLANDHGFPDGNKQIAFTATDVFLRRNGLYIEVGALAEYEFIVRSMERHEFRLPKILDWIRQHIKPLE